MESDQDYENLIRTRTRTRSGCLGFREIKYLFKPNRPVQFLILTGLRLNKSSRTGPVQSVTVRFLSRTWKTHFNRLSNGPDTNSAVLVLKLGLNLEFGSVRDR